MNSQEATLQAETRPAAPTARRHWLKGLGALLGGLVLSRAAKAAPAATKQALGGTPYLGEIQLFAFGFAPRGWLPCNGQVLSIAQNTALFSLLGTTFGGNGQTTFALPDFRGRMPVGMGNSSSGNSYQLGQSAGSENVTLTAGDLPAHNHGYQVSNATATATTGTLPVSVDAVVPPGSDLNGETVNVLAYASVPSAGAAEAGSTLAPAGSSQLVNVLAPYETLNFCIATAGIYPSRN